MNNHNYRDNIDLPDSGGLTNAENYSGSTSSAYDEVSPNTHNSTPGSNDSNYEINNQSTISSKKSKNSQLSNEDNPNLTIDALEKTLTEDKTSKIKEIISLITNLSDTEKILLQLKFPLADIENTTYESNNSDLNSNFDMNGNCSQNEHSEAITWVSSHLEENKTTCLRKEDVYKDYKTYCNSHNIKCLSTADFGKVMKKVFPHVKARRLGARGKSKYCYSEMKMRYEIQSPMLIDVGLNLEGNENINEYHKRDNNTNSEVESYSSSSMQNDLSHVPEYELGPNIIIDSALVILDFIKKVASNKNIMSLKQAVRQLLINNQVETRSPHALRLLAIFKQMEGHKPYMNKKSSVDQTFNSIKKEETLSSPCSVTQQRASTASPQNQKRRNMEYSPIPAKIPAYNDYQKFQQHNSPINPSQNFNNTKLNSNYNTNYYNNNIQSNVLPMSHNINVSLNNLRPEMPPVSLLNTLPQKAFIPTNYSTPVKNATIPELNSPLLDRSPATTKKLDMSNPKMFYQNNSVVYPNIHDRSIGVKNSCYDSTDRYGPYQHNLYELRKPPLNLCHTNDYRHQEVTSPITLNPRYDREPLDNYETLQKIDTSLPLRHIDENDYREIDFGLSPRLDHFGSRLMPSSKYGFIQSPNTATKPFLNTPGNSPSHNDIELSDYVVCHGEQPSLTQMSVKHDNYNTVTDKTNIKALHTTMWSQISMDPTSNHFSIHHSRLNDETNVTSTTNTGLTDHDVNPSTTVTHHSIFK